jgi:hypothetical protein
LRSRGQGSGVRGQGKAKAKAKALVILSRRSTAKELKIAGSCLFLEMNPGWFIRRERVTLRIKWEIR